MTTSIKFSALVAGALVAAACSTYKASPELTYYHGQNVPEGFITVLRASPAEITFQVRVKFVQKQMYHLVLDGNTPVAEGWFSTLRAGGEQYTATMRPKDGLTFEAGKTYRLCIGVQSPQAVQMTSSNYQCVADFTFVFKEKA
ncbi:MAG: hypothetical protein HGA24_03665 [Candidatus Aminicenantes bacterium]|nr:hypothetical protein [Candidatus Aminicenantes bacterium]